VRAVLDGKPRTYDAQWRAETRRYRWLTASLLAAANQPKVRRTIVPAAVHAPWVFARIVNALA
jgi:hypothetical protein